MADDLDFLKLFPAPRFLERTGGTFGGDPDAVRVRRDPSLEGESYELTITPDGIEVLHADANGERFARQTLSQICRRRAGPIPCLVIRDGPDFPVRGYMLDVSRDRVPTRGTLERIVDLLARVRINHLQLYTEHTYAYRDHEEVWREASPITPDDVRWLDDLCRSRGIELAANQNVFGHMERWLKHERYRPLAESPDGWETRWGRVQSPAVLAPTDESFAFVRDLLDELLPAFSSRRVNVNCDETFELGRGRSRAEVEERGRGVVYLDFVRRVLDHLHDQGKDVLFWGDIVRQSPELVGRLPRRDTTALAWHYEGPMDPDRLPAELFDILGDFGITRDSMRGFAGHVAPFAEAAFPFWVCPGTSSWNSLVGRLPNARANLLDAAEVGRSAGARGYLVTDWGDNGHFQPPTVSFPPIAYGAAVSWCARTNRDAPIAAFLDEEVFVDASGRLGRALEAAGGLSAKTGVEPMNGSVLHYQLLGGGLSFLARLLGSPDRAGLESVVEEIDDLRATIESARPECSDGGVVQRELRQALRLARHGAWRSARQSDFPAPSDEHLRDDLVEAIAEQRECWLERSRPGGLSDSLARLEGTLAEYGGRGPSGSGS